MAMDSNDGRRNAGPASPERERGRPAGSADHANRMATRAHEWPATLDGALTPLGRGDRGRRRPLLSVVVPAYNEQACIPILVERLTGVLTGLGVFYEIILVNDGSSDGTLDEIRRLARDDARVGWISFSRNFGHEAASTAGLDRARGDAVVLMDADLQDPPELIPRMLEQWRGGYEVVYAKRRRRPGETWLKRSTAWAFYRLLDAVTQVAIPADTGDFRLMDHRVIAEFRRLGEQHRFVRGMIAWLGFRQTAVEFDRPERAGGDPKYGVVKLAALSLDAILGFSTVPLRLASAFGLVTVAASMAAGVAVLVHKLVWGIPLAGYALLACGVFFVGGVQMLLLGIAGEYIGRIYTQVQQRPLYVVEDQSSPPAGLISADPAAAASDGATSVEPAVGVHAPAY